MSETPTAPSSDELLQLWTQRDAVPGDADDRIVLAYKPGDEPGAVRSRNRTVKPEPISHQNAPRKTIIPEVTPVPTIKIFPSIKIAPQPVNLAIDHVPKSKR